MQGQRQLRTIAVASLATLVLAACASSGGAKNAWTEADLSSALANPARPQEDRDRDADRRPAKLMTFLGVERGMTALDVIASGGYMTDVLAVAVGSTGKVYAQNPPAFLRYQNGAYDKAMTARLAGNRLPHVVRVDSDLPASSTIPAGTVDVAVTAMNLHDIYNRDAAAGQAFLKDVYTMLKPGGVFGVIDHVGKVGGENQKLHRMPKSVAVEGAKAVGFVIEAESDMYANPNDDHTKGPFDPALRGKTDQFVLKLRKPG